MSRVHDALRKAAQQNPEPTRQKAAPKQEVYRAMEEIAAGPVTSRLNESPIYGAAPAPPAEPAATAALRIDPADLDNLEDAIRGAREFPYLRTRLNHLQTLQPLRTLVVTSASPAEGKSFTAMNLAIAQAQLAEKRVLLADFDFRRPSIDKAFQIDTSPGLTEYLLGKARIGEVIRKISDANLYLMTAGEAVPNPLELLNLKECRALLEALRSHFDWVILDSPPLLFAADGNLLATMCDGTILVVRIGATTFDAVTRAMQSLCENNVLGVVVNGARRSELYSKYSYYHDYYYAPDGENQTDTDQEEAETVSSESRA